jgi:hypothetical protein
MNSLITRLTLVMAGTTAWACAQTITYTNFIRQIQQPTGVQWDMSVTAVSPTGGSLSPLAIDPGGAQFQLWTVKSTPLTNYLLDTKYVGTYVPVADVVIRSEDPYPAIPRTRADRPFYVDVTITGLLNGATDPAASKSVKLLRHVQSYGVGGTGVVIDRTQATLLTQVSIAANGMQTLTYAVNSVPGANRAKVRGEERFSVFSLADYQAPESQLASQFIQFWPVADGTITGIVDGQIIRMGMPQVTFTLHDLYPDSRTYAQIYKGSPQSGTTGAVVPGSNLVINDSIPSDRVLVVNNYDSLLDSDGLWTMELLTLTPFGIDRLAYVSFTLNRTIEVNSGITTIE